LPELENKQSFWTTIPGILTGLAAVLTAGTGLFLALNHPHDAASQSDHSAPPVASSPAPSSALAPATNPVSPAPDAASKDNVTLISKSGEVNHLTKKSFRHGVAGKAIELTSGQTVPFEKIRSIDFGTVSNSEVTVSVALTDGRVISGSLSTNAGFEGENDIGPFSIYVANVKRIVLQP
jgi:hypothetical protein